MSDPIALANAKAKGKRPWFFENREAERVFNVALALMQELAVTRERLDTLERLLESKGMLSRQEIESFAPNAAEANARSLMHKELIGRCLRVLQQELEALEESPGLAASPEELASI
jgi:hypothetical protein